MEKIDLIYNFSGTAQYFCKIPQLIKVHNLLFYSKKIDQIYFQKKQYISWVKQIFLRRIVLHSMVRNIHYVEIQSNHVRVYMNDFINISKKKFFIKSDIALLKELFSKPKRYDFSKKIRFLYIVGPHFEYLHKNFEDFIMVMKKLSKEGFNFEIVITLTKDQLSNSTIWDKRLDKRTMFLGYMSKEELKKQFQDNTILISTSVIETLGLHVIEAIQNGILTIVPNEKYSSDVYGKNILEYNLFNSESLVKTVKRIALLKGNNIRDMISKNQQYLIENENKKDQSITDAFDHIIKVKNV